MVAMIFGKQLRVSAPGAEVRFLGLAALAGIVLSSAAALGVSWTIEQNLGTDSQLAPLGAFAVLLMIAGLVVVSYVARETGRLAFLRWLFIVSFVLRITLTLWFYFIIPTLVKDQPYLSHAFFNDDGIAY